MAAFDRATAPGNLDLGSSLISTLGQPGCHGNSRSRWPIVNVVRMSNLILVCRCARYTTLYYAILHRDEQPCYSSAGVLVILRCTMLYYVRMSNLTHVQVCSLYYVILHRDEQP